MTADIIGRTPALVQLTAALDRGADALALAVVRGAAGMGKSTLIDHIVDALPDRAVLRAAGRSQQTTAPLSLIAELVGHRALENQSDVDEREADRDEIGAEVARAADALLDRIAACTTEHPGVVVVDDLQWADRASVEVLRLVVGRALHDRITVLVALRPVPESRDDVRALLASVAKLGGTTVELGPLGEADARHLVTSLAGDLPDDDLRTCVEASGGNPLVLRHLARELAQGSSVSESLRPVVGERMRGLSDDAARAVSIAAVGGEEIPVDALAEIVGSTEHQIVAWLEQAALAGLVRLDGDRWRFDHDLVREAVAESLGAAEGADVHRRWASTLRRRDQHGTGRAAAHLLAAGPPYASWELDVLLASAVETLPTSPATAADTFDVVMAHTEPDDDRHRAARTGAAEARLWSSRHEAPDETADAGAMARLQQEFAQGRVSTTTLDDAERWARESLSGAQLDETLARIATYAATSRQPRPHLTDELDERADSLSPLAEVWLRHAQDRTLVLTGEFVEAMWIGERAQAAGDRLPADHPARVEAAVTFGRLACQLELRRAEGFESLRWAEQRAEELGSTTRQLDVYLEHGIQLRMWDHWDEADARFTAGATLAEEHDAVTTQDLFELELVGLAIPRGDITRAEALIVGRAGRPDPVALWAAHVGYLRLMQGDLDAAIRTLIPLAEGRDVFPEVRRLALEVLALAAFAADDHAARDALRAGCRLLSYDALPARVCRAMVLATADGASEVADTVLGDLTVAPPFIKGNYELLGGIAHRRAGNDERAVECFRSAHARATDRGAAATARFIERALDDLGVRTSIRTGDRPVTGWGAITPAEMRVVELVAEGLVYREVAERLYLSRRTVESHVASALRKLGLRNRSELAAAFLTDRPRLT